MGCSELFALWAACVVIRPAAGYVGCQPGKYLQARRLVPVCAKGFAPPLAVRVQAPNKHMLLLAKSDGEGWTQYFVPGFVAVWALGYAGITIQQLTFQQKGGGEELRELGERGGLLAVALTCLLFVALVGAALYESFKE